MRRGGSQEARSKPPSAYHLTRGHLQAEELFDKWTANPSPPTAIYLPILYPFPDTGIGMSAPALGLRDIENSKVKERIDVIKRHWRQCPE